MSTNHFTGQTIWIVLERTHGDPSCVSVEGAYHSEDEAEARAIRLTVERAEDYGIEWQPGDDEFDGDCDLPFFVDATYLPTKVAA